MLSRRKFLQQTALGLVTHSLLQAGFTSEAFAAPVRSKLERWLLDLNELCGDLKTHSLTPLQWQAKMEELYSGIELAELLKFIDFDLLARGLEFPEDRATVKPVVFPKLEGLPARPVRAKIFGMAKGRAIVPHGHNDLVSAHLVIKGRFRVRTFDRVFSGETPNKSLLIRPSIDASWGGGRLLTMSDEQDNLHWLVAESAEAFTFDVPLGSLGFRESYPSQAQYSSMIFVDPTGKANQDGTVTAEIIKPDQAFAKFGRS